MIGGQPSDFSCEVVERDERLVVVVRGELDLASAPELEDVTLQPARDGRHVVFDLRALDFMDSSGIRVLITAHHAAVESGGRVTVAAGRGTGEVARVLAISGLDGILELVDEP
jgi:anti-anti-sigma factor